MRGNSHVRFLGGRAVATLPAYPTINRGRIALVGEGWGEGAEPDQCSIWLRNNLVRSCCGAVKICSGVPCSTI
jgi:hypothetical protein